MTGMPTTNTHNRYTNKNAAPPFSPAIYGKRQMLPNPIAEPAATSMALNLPPNEALGCSFIIFIQ
jgi:hypothetical protein